MQGNTVFFHIVTNSLFANQFSDAGVTKLNLGAAHDNFLKFWSRKQPWTGERRKCL
jgi:hypothetical protein